MNHILNTIASAVVSKKMEDCSAGELKNLADEYPFAGALQLLYAEKLKTENSDAFSTQWQKTLLYFNDPLFLQYKIRSSFEKSTSSSKDDLIEATAPPLSTTEDDIDPLPENIVVDELAEDQESEPISIPGLKIEPIDPEKAAFNFTPYFTVDYFASQGIKLGENAKQTDRFGNQLKTFTSWLKEMRRLPEATVVAKFSAFEQNSVEKMAETSLNGENAITDAMAEVWIKQGNKQKAIEVYKKLKLQNPAKSAFFAAKIEHLKKQL